MKAIIFFTLLLSAAQAQTKEAVSVVTFTTKQLSDTVRAQKVRMDLILWQNERLNQRATVLEKKLDSVGVYLNEDDFEYDSATKTYSINWEGIILRRKEKQDMGIKAVVKPVVQTKETYRYLSDDLDSLIISSGKKINKQKKKQNN